MKSLRIHKSVVETKATILDLLVTQLEAKNEAFHLYLNYKKRQNCFG